MSHLEITGLSKEYGDGTVAVRDVDISLERGELLVLVGPSGCGKTTLLRTIAGLETATTGTVRIDGVDVSGRDPEDRDVAMVFQSYALYPHMTARENLSFGLRMGGELGAGAIEERVADIAAMLDIEELLGKRPAELSGGQKQRVALGRAIVRDPEVFLMDEPLSNLDASLRAEMRTEIQRLQRRLGTTTVYVTHDQTEAMTMADTVAVLNEGRVEQVAPPETCYWAPATRFVAGFIGEPSMNFLETRREDGTLVGLSTSLRYPLEETGLSPDPAVERVTVGIRPPAVVLGDEPGPRTVGGTVSVLEPVGERTYVHVDVGDRELTAEVDGRPDLRAGDAVEVTLPPDRVHLFDADSGQALRNAEPGETVPETVTGRGPGPGSGSGPEPVGDDR